MGGDYVTRRCLATLRPGKLLNDEVISYYYRMLGEGDKEACEQDYGRRRCHVFNSFFITKLLNEGHCDLGVEGTYDYGRVKKLGKQGSGKRYIQPSQNIHTHQCSLLSLGMCSGVRSICKVFFGTFSTSTKQYMDDLCHPPPTGS